MKLCNVELTYIPKYNANKDNKRNIITGYVSTHQYISSGDTYYKVRLSKNFSHQINQRDVVEITEVTDLITIMLFNLENDI